MLWGYPPWKCLLASCISGNLRALPHVEAAVGPQRSHRAAAAAAPIVMPSLLVTLISSKTNIMCIEQFRESNQISETFSSARLCNHSVLHFCTTRWRWLPLYWLKKPLIKIKFSVWHFHVLLLLLLQSIHATACKACQSSIFTTCKRFARSLLKLQILIFFGSWM